MQKITPFLWLDDKAEEAARLYTSVFRNSTIDEVRHYGEGGPRPKGSAMSKLDIKTLQLAHAGEPT